MKLKRSKLNSVWIRWKPKVGVDRWLTFSFVSVWLANLTFPNVPLPSALPIEQKQKMNKKAISIFNYDNWKQRKENETYPRHNGQV